MSQIDDKYAQLGGANSFMGPPMGPEYTSPASSITLRRRDYQNGSIYYWDQSQDGAHEVHGAIAQKFTSANAELGSLGFPVSDQKILPDGIGSASYFANGAIYSQPNGGIFEVYGTIGARYQSIGGPLSVLGYPKSDEADTSDHTGRWNQFKHGVIYWRHDIGAHEVHGAILQKWNSLAAQAGSLGYPLTNEIPVATPSDGRQNKFEHGTILWTPAGGAIVI